MSILTRDGVLIAYRAAVSAGLGKLREGLLARIDWDFVGGLSIQPDTNAQIFCDLDAMNAAGTLDDGSVPILIWLENAANLAKPKHQAQVFRRLLVGSTPPPPLACPCPFPGLESFSEELAPVFFGRDSACDALVGDRVRGKRWIQIEGASGVGKSSFVHAGLLPRLRRGEGPWPRAAHVLLMRPGCDPVLNLATAMFRAFGKGGVGKLDRMKRVLDTSDDGLITLALEQSVRGDGIFLLVIDQLEEVFTLRREDDGATRRFDTLVSRALGTTDVSFHLVTTLRSEFNNRFGGMPKLDEQRGRACRYALGNLGRAELHEVINGPTAQAMISWEPGLPELITCDAEKAIAGLPLVAYTLRELWEARRGDTITYASYAALGRVEGALARSADAVVKALGDEGQEPARKLFLRLVKTGRGVEDVRQTVSWVDAIAASGGGQEAERVLQLLSGARGSLPSVGELSRVRLLVVSEDAGQEQVDLVHEALLRQWPTLVDWISKHREALEMRDDLEDLARIWARDGKSDGGFPTGDRLVRWRKAEGTNALAKEYLAAAKKHDEKHAKAIRDRLLSTQRRQYRWILRLVALVIGLVIMAVRALVLANQLEMSKRAQIEQANRKMASLVSGTVLSQLRSLGDAVEQQASSGQLSQALLSHDLAKLQAFCESTYAFYDDPTHGLRPNGISPFDMWFLLDDKGVIQAHFGKKHGSVAVGMDYSFRDYFKEPLRAAEMGSRSAYVSRSFKSEYDDLYKFAISAPIMLNEKRPSGVLVAAVASNASLGSLALDPSQGIAVLVAPRDRERDASKVELPYLLLRHPGFDYGKAVGMKSELVRLVSHDGLSDQERFQQQLWPAQLERVRASDEYEDPAAESLPSYAGPWFAGLAPVGNTGFVVIIQTPRSEAISEMNLFWMFVKWFVIASLPGVLLLQGYALERWRRRRGSSPVPR